MRLSSLFLTIITTFATISCVFAQGSFVIREVPGLSKFEFTFGENGAGWYLLMDEVEADLRTILVGPKGYRRDISSLLPDRGAPIGITSEGDLFFEERAGRGKTKIVRVLREGDTPITVGFLRRGTTVQTSPAGETYSVRLLGSRALKKALLVTTLSPNGKVSGRQIRLKMPISGANIAPEIFAEADGRLTILLYSGQYASKLNAVCSGRDGVKDLECRAYQGRDPIDQVELVANGKIVTGDYPLSRAALVDAATLRVEREIYAEGDGEQLLRPFVEKDGKFGALFFDYVTNQLRVKFVTPSGERVSRRCLTSLTFTYCPPGVALNRRTDGATIFLIHYEDNDDGGRRLLYQLKYEDGIRDESGEIVGTCEVEEPASK